MLKNISLFISLICSLQSFAAEETATAETENDTTIEVVVTSTDLGGKFGSNQSN